MYIVKPNWVIHGDDKGTPQTIYSVHVHPDGTRLATGSIQNVVKIWSTAPILDSSAEESGEQKVPRLLCSMEGHDGAVLCVRWTYSGGFLATGSDDSIIMVWLRCPGQSRSFGSKTANIEDWKPFKRLAGHTSDVSGLAWSEDDQYLASVGLDNLVLIWDCLDSSFLLLRRLDLHQGHVSGVAWDPVGQYLATQSDDRSVKIWRTSDWKLEADITQPFIESPRSFFRRLSWSPEGAHLVTPNAMNGPVFVSSVIERAQWTSDISLVGHHNVVEVAAYNPHVFLRNKDDPLEGRNLCAALALGARSSISIWLTSSSVPLLVLHDVFNRDILDLSWAADGVTLYACSSDGHVAVLVIEELKSIITMAPPEAKAEYHKNYHFKKPDRRQQSRASLTPYAQRYPSPMPIEPYKPGSFSHPPIGSLDQASASRSSASSLAQQEMTIMPNGKRRIRPVFLGNSEGDMYPMPQVNGHSTSSLQTSSVQSYNPRPQLSQRIPNHSMALDPHPSTSQRTLSAASRVPKFLVDDLSPSNASSHGMGQVLIWDDNDEWSEPITIPPTLLKTARQSDTELQLDCQNNRESMNDAAHYAEVKLLVSTQREQIWIERFPRRMAISAAVCDTHFAIAFHDGSLFVFSRSGRRTLPVVMMDCPCYVLQFRERMLMVISSKGAVMVWNLENCRTMGPALQLKDLEVSKRSISCSALTATGLPIIGLKSGSLFTYDRDLQCWTFLVDGLVAGSKSPTQLSRLTHVDGSQLALDAAMVLGSKAELQTCLVNHARSLRGENSFAKAEELCEELWTGRRCGFQSGSESVLSGKLELRKEERLKLLSIIIDVLRESNEFRPICDEYSVLLRHAHL